MAEETFKVDTEKEEDDKIVLDTSSGKGMENMQIPENMRAPVFEGGRISDEKQKVVVIYKNKSRYEGIMVEGAACGYGCPGQRHHGRGRGQERARGHRL